ncbi:MAG: methyltransferase domain-containing protein [Chitinophagaceae bacterium]
MNLATRSYQQELLDADDIPFEAIKRNMQELNFINTKLGGHGISVQGLAALAAKKKHLHICEIGCGGGDNMLALLRYCQQQNIAATFTGIDIKQSCIDFAATRSALQTCTTWISSDYIEARFTRKPDIIFSSLFCHHFTNDQLITQLRWMKENSVSGFFINDLQRHWLAYRSIKLLTQLFSKSYLVKNDAPLSVARGFTKMDWQKIFAKAGIHEYTIRWKWAFRFLIVCRNV